jgi:hypothetical protein
MLFLSCIVMKRATCDHRHCRDQPPTSQDASHPSTCPACSLCSSFPRSTALWRPFSHAWQGGTGGRCCLHRVPPRSPRRASPPSGAHRRHHARAPPGPTLHPSRRLKALWRLFSRTSWAGTGGYRVAYDLSEKGYKLNRYHGMAVLMDLVGGKSNQKKLESKHRPKKIPPF